MSSFLPNLGYSLASTVSAALGKGHPTKGSTTTTVAGPGSLHHSNHNHHRHSYSQSNNSSNNDSNGANNNKRYSHSRRHSNTNYNFSRSNGPSNSSTPMTPPHSPNHYSHSGVPNDRRSARKRNPSVSSMPRTPPSSPQMDNNSSFEAGHSAYNFSRKRNYLDNQRPSSYHGSVHGANINNNSHHSSNNSSHQSKSSTQPGVSAAESKKKSSSSNNATNNDATPKAPTTPEERYRIVDDILETESLYRVLAVNRSATSEEIRRAYIAKSRVCHPDKFPEYPRATEAFQKLSLAYETLSKPSSRFVYDSTGGSASRSMMGSEETLQSVLSQVFFEFMDGDFEVIRNMINTMNNTAGGVRLGEDAIGVIEDMFLRLRFVLHGCKKYMTLVHDQVQQLSDIHHGMRSLAYLDVLGRFRLTLKLSKVMLTIPMIIQDEMKRENAVAAALENSTEQNDNGGKKNAGLVENVFLNDRVETVLKKVVSAIETGERWV